MNCMVKCKYCNSIAQFLIDKYGEDALNNYWDYEKNERDPWLVQRASSKSVWLIYNDISKLITCNTFTRKRRLGKYKELKKSVNIIKSKTVNADRILAYYSPDSIKYWSDLNKYTAFDYTYGSTVFVYWKCKKGYHDDYLRSINGARKTNYRCPMCYREDHRQELQTLVENYIHLKYNDYKLKFEHNCTIIPINPKTNSPMPYDIEIIDLKLIIEVNGMQHYLVSKTHVYDAKQRNTSPQQEFFDQQLRDIYKQKYAISNGYNYLIIPWWSQINDYYKILIDEKIYESINKSIGVDQVCVIN